MPRMTIDLAFMPYATMLVVEHPSGVAYRNQVGGVTCWQAEVEGVLAPINISDAGVEKIMNLSYKPGHGVSIETADSIDAILAAEPCGRHLTVDRNRLHES